MAFSNNNQKVNQKAADILLSWKMDLNKFAREAVGFSPSNQQSEFFDVLCKMVWAKIWCGDYHKGKTQDNPTPEAWELNKKFGISVMSAKGTGKDAAIVIANKWFLTMFPSPRIVCTAPTKEHLSQVMWSEFAKWYNKTDENGEFIFKLRDMIAIEAETIYLKNSPTPKREGVMIQRTAKITSDTGTAEAALSGQHDDYMLIEFDEAAGVHDVVFDGLNSTLTDPCNIAILIFNPHRRTGYAVRTHYDDAVIPFWHQIHWSALDSSVVSESSKERMKLAYPIDSDMYRINVLGLPANQSDGTLIPFDWIYEATLRDPTYAGNERIQLGVDPAGGGKDSTMCCLKAGHHVKEFIEVYAKDTLDIARRILEIAKEKKVEVICVDSIGVGKGVYDMLNKYFPTVYGVQVHETAQNSGRFKIYRNELYWRLRTDFETGTIIIPNDQKFIQEVSGISYKEEKYVEVEQKVSMRKRLGRSPDRLDSLLVLMHLSKTMQSNLFDGELDFYPFDEVDTSSSGTTWMGR